MEDKLVWLIPLRLAVLAIFVTCYVIGGREKKWVRRFVGPTVLMLGVTGVSTAYGNFSWWYFPAFIPLYVGLSFGYGADRFFVKVARRALYGLVIGSTGFILGLIGEAPVLGSIQLISAITGSVLIGVTNEQVAVNEEAIIALACVWLVPFLV